MALRCICHEPDNSDWAPHNQHLIEPQVTKDEKEEEEPPAEESDWDADLKDVPDYHPTLRRQPWQQPKVLMFQPIRKCPAGWLAGIRPKCPLNLTVYETDITSHSQKKKRNVNT